MSKLIFKCNPQVCRRKECIKEPLAEICSCYAAGPCMRSTMLRRFSRRYKKCPGCVCQQDLGSGENKGRKLRWQMRYARKIRGLIMLYDCFIPRRDWTRKPLRPRNGSESLANDWWNWVPTCCLRDLIERVPRCLVYYDVRCLYCEPWTIAKCWEPWSGLDDWNDLSAESNIVGAESNGI